MKAPSRAEIEGVERRLIKSRHDARQGIDRTRLAFKAALARQTPWIAFAVVAGATAFWFDSRRRHAASPSESPDHAAKAGPVRILLSGLAMQALAVAIQRLAAPWLKAGETAP